MNKVLYAIVSLLALTSCANTFHITGTTSVSGLDGQKLYLKVLKDTSLRNLDSCDVVHGQFEFAGTMDSVRVANIILDDNNSLPVVLESGDIDVKIDNTQETVSGTPLNDKPEQVPRKVQSVARSERRPRAQARPGHHEWQKYECGQRTGSRLRMHASMTG